MADHGLSEAFIKALDRETARVDKEIQIAEKESTRTFERQQRALAAGQTLSRIVESAEDWTEVYP